MTTQQVAAISKLRHKDLLGISDLTPDEILLILDTAEAMREIGDRPIKKVPALRGKTVVNLFFEASTRTRTSFEIAEKRLSADTLNIAAQTSSLVKGETLVDTALNLEAMAPDMIVLRHAYSGACHLLSRICRAGIINAGDGMHEHPTQALLDAFTIREHKKRIAGLKVAIVGDLLHSRVLRSNVQLLTKLGADVWVSGPPTLMPPGIEREGVRRNHVGGRSRRGRRRRDAASRAARADAGRVLSLAARVLHGVRHDARAAAAGEARRHHHAPRSDEPRRRNRLGSRRRTVFGDSRTGCQRRCRADGGVVSTGGWSGT